MARFVLKKSIILIILAAALLSACQPTPGEPVVVNKAGGELEQIIQRTQPPGEAAKPYEAPERLSMEVEGLEDGYRIAFDAGIEVPDQTEWPVYVVGPAKITQEQADAVRTALTGSAILYKPGKYRSRKEIQRSIDSYEEELKLSEGYPELIDSYRKILKDLYAEYERTPEDFEMEKADTDFSFMEGRTMTFLYGGKKTETNKDGGFRYEWTDEARQNAISAGCESIYGVCWMDSGRKMEFSAGNGDTGYDQNSISFNTADGNLAEDPGVSYSLEEAETKGSELLASMGLDFKLVHAETWMNLEPDEQGEYVDAGMGFHTLTYKRNIEDAPQNGVIGIIDRNKSKPGPEAEFRLPALSETIIITYDDLGVRSFSWGRAMLVVSKETKNAALLPWDEVKNRIIQQIKSQTIWSDKDDPENKWIDERRVEISKIKLSYLIVAKKDDIENYYLLPVWSVCGDLIYHYKSDYPTGQSNTYILDDNFERNVWRPLGDTKDYAIVTINAIEGSAVDRNRGY